MKNNLKNMGWVLLIGLTLNACKKDAAETQLTDAQRIEKAKSWFGEQQKNQVTTLNVQKGKAVNLTYLPDWDHATVQQIDGSTVITANVKTNLQSVYGENTHFDLVIKVDNGSYQSKTLKIRPNESKEYKALSPIELYKTAFTDADLSAENINAEIKVYDARFKSNGSILYTATGKTMIAPQKPQSDWKPYSQITLDGKQTFRANDLPLKMEPEQHCYDAYMVTRIYENGILVDIYQEYMGFQICTDEYFDPEHPFGSGGGSPGEVGSSDVYLNFGTPASEVTGEVMLISNDTLRRKRSAWTFSDGGSFKLKSREIITQVKFGNGGWNYAAASHDSHYPEGYAVNAEVEISDFRWSQTCNLSSVTVYVEWRTKLKVTPGQVPGSGTRYGPWDESLHMWKEWN